MFLENQITFRSTLQVRSSKNLTDNNLHNIVFASPSKSQVKVLQSIGRGLRKSDNGQDTKLYDLSDDLSWQSKKNFTLKHAEERVKMYTKEKFEFELHKVHI